MAYESNKEKIYNYFLNKIFPQMDIFGIDYYKTISTISSELRISSKMVEEVFKELFQSEKITEIRIIELTKEELIKRSKEKEEIEKETKKEVETIKESVLIDFKDKPLKEIKLNGELEKEDVYK